MESGQVLSTKRSLSLFPGPLIMACVWEQERMVLEMDDAMEGTCTALSIGIPGHFDILAICSSVGGTQNCGSSRNSWTWTASMECESSF
jgi:hypothetical protein